MEATMAASVMRVKNCFINVDISDGEVEPGRPRSKSDSCVDVRVPDRSRPVVAKSTWVSEDSTYDGRASPLDCPSDFEERLGDTEPAVDFKKTFDAFDGDDGETSAGDARNFVDTSDADDSEGSQRGDLPQTSDASWGDSSDGSSIWMMPCYGPWAVAAPMPVPRVPASQTQATQLDAADWTTMTFKNVPNNYTRDMLLALLDAEGFKCMYDFVYLPIDLTRRSKSNKGYAFINFTSHESALRFQRHFEGFRRWSVRTRKQGAVEWARANTQGRQRHIEHYRNKDLMRPTYRDDCKPVLLDNGIPVAFPESTKRR